MADPARTATRPLTRSSVQKAHDLIRPWIHETPVLTSTYLSTLASTPSATAPSPSRPRIRIFLKCENMQKIGAFKARGAYHALARLYPAELARGVVTHSSGNHAQALAHAARARGVTAHVVMPSISTPTKIAATRGYGAHVHLSGSTAAEREAAVAQVQRDTGAILVPPYDHPDIILGQGTLALEFEGQVKALLASEREAEARCEGFGWRARKEGAGVPSSEGLDAIISAVGGGGMLSGIATAMEGTGVSVFAGEPAFQGADDCARGLRAVPPKRIEVVKSLTIADGARTPVGKIPWGVISDSNKVRGVYAVSEEQIKEAMRLVLERAKVLVEPTAAVPLAVVLFNEEFRGLVEREGGEDGWNVGVVLGGGNTSVEAIAKLFGTGEKEGQRAEGKVGVDGSSVAENVAG